MTVNHHQKSSDLPAEGQVFAQSLLWDLQRQYFAAKGVATWRQGC